MNFVFQHSVSGDDEIVRDITRISGFPKSGPPNTKLSFRFLSCDTHDKYEAMVHADVLEKSPIFKLWLDATTPAENGNREIGAEISGCTGLDFQKFFVYLYTKELNPVDLMRIFDLASKYQVIQMLA